VIKHVSPRDVLIVIKGGIDRGDSWWKYCLLSLSLAMASPLRRRTRWWRLGRICHLLRHTARVHLGAHLLAGELRE
jgi:hypothetical protein